MIYSHDYSRTGFTPSAPIVEIQLKHPVTTRISHKFMALVDSGADGTLIPRSFLRGIGAIHRGNRRLTGILKGGKVVDIFLVTVMIGTIAVTGVEVAAIDEDEMPIVGRDVLNQLIVTLNGLAGVVEISD